MSHSVLIFCLHTEADVKQNRKMKKLVLLIIPALISGIVFTSCGKDNLPDVNETGETYVGTYTWTNLSRGWSWSTTPTIVLNNGKYTYKGLADGSYYDSGSGNYTITGNKIIFELTYYPKPMATIGVLNSWLLKGEYEHEFNGDNLRFSKMSTEGDEYRAEFELKKIVSR